MFATTFQKFVALYDHVSQKDSVAYFKELNSIVRTIVPNVPESITIMNGVEFYEELGLNDLKDIPSLAILQDEVSNLSQGVMVTSFEKFMLLIFFPQHVVVRHCVLQKPRLYHSENAARDFCANQLLLFASNFVKFPTASV